MKRFSAPIAILTSIVLIILSGWLGYESVNRSFSPISVVSSLRPTTPTPEVRTARVTRGDVTQILTAPGDVIPAHTQDLTFSGGGHLIELNVLPGDQVSKGQVLASVDPEPLKLALAQAQVNYQSKQDALNTLKLSALPNSTDLKQAEVDVQSAQVALNQAEQDLTGATMLAPFNGRVLSVNANLGDTVAANAVVIELADLSRLELETTVAQEDVVMVKDGQSATLTFDARPGETYPGKVTRIVPTRASTSGAVTYSVYVSVDQAPPGLLPGMTADADIIIAERKDVLTLPRRSIRANANSTVSVAVLQRGQTENRNVTVGLVGDLNIEIVSGLQEGEQVVTTQ